MKTELLLLAGVALMMATVPAVSHAEDNEGWMTRSPLALGEPMEDCGPSHDVPAAVPVASEAVPANALPRTEAILAAPPSSAPPSSALPSSAPGVTPAVLPATSRPPAGSTTQLSPPPPQKRNLPTAALLTFALIASPGTALPQTGNGARD